MTKFYDSNIVKNKRNRLQLAIGGGLVLQDGAITQIEKDSMGMGSNSVTWDGLQMDGSVAGKGDYSFDVKAWDDEYQTFSGETKAEGVITGVDFEDGQTMLTIDGKKKVALKDVESFFMPKEAEKKFLGAKNHQLEKNLKTKANAAYNNLSETNL